MAGKNGGPRPGAGRKKPATVAEQATRRDIVMDVVDATAWRKHVKSLVAQSERGNYAAMLPLYPYLLGSPRQEVAITFDPVQASQDLAAEYGVSPEKVTSIIERMRARKTG